MSGVVTSPRERAAPSLRDPLLLNASFEPLGVISWRRAVCLVLDDRAESVVDGSAMVRSQRFEMPLPAVVRLRAMVSVPRARRVVRVSRRAVFVRDGFKCQYCGRHADSIDHVVPRSRGGAHVWENLVAACRRCNGSKRDRTPDEAGMVLARPCRAPRVSGWAAGPSGSVPAEWEPYLSTRSNGRAGR